MKLGILGAGSVGGTLGKGWAKKGHTVVLGVRDAVDPKVMALLKNAGPNARAVRVREAAAFAELEALTVPWNRA